MASPSQRALADFLSEAQETIEQFAAELVRLEPESREPEPDVVNTLFRGAHTLKGLSGMFGVSALAELSHHAEDLLDALRMGRVPFDRARADLLLEFANDASALLGPLARGEEQPEQASALVRLGARLAEAATERKAVAVVDALDAAGIDASVRAVLTEYEEHRLRDNLKKGAAIIRVRVAFDLADFDIRLGELNGKLKPLGEVVSTLPSPEAGEGIAFDLLFATTQSQAAVAQAIAPIAAQLERLGNKAGSGAESAPVAPPIPKSRPPSAANRPLVPPTVSMPAVDLPVATVARPPSLAGQVATSRPPSRPASGSVPQAAATAAAMEEISLRSITQTVRVDISKLDELMNIVGELVVSRTNLQRLAERLRQPLEGAAQRVMQAELARETRVLERRISALQTGVLDVRMVPLGNVFDKLTRLVRKIAREAGKELDFRVVGSEVELDKLIVEELSDPLMHIIRNALDHGLELPEVRERQGKPRRGTLSVTAGRQGNHVVIEVTDDGAGIDARRVRDVAVARGLTTERQALELTQRELFNFIFMPGFSTATSVSSLSGRGVGMDVVKTNIARLSGIIDVRSMPGHGSTFAITLPETLAILKALLVGTEGRTYAIPLNSVLEVVEVPVRSLSTLEGREVMDLRGQSLPVARLGRVFRHTPALGQERKSLHVVVVGLAQQRLGIAVDGLEGQQDIVIKPLGKVLGTVPGIAGATDLGNRQTVLVLDVGAIVEEVLSAERGGGREVA